MLGRDRDRDRVEVDRSSAPRTHPALRVMGLIALLVVLPSLLYLAHVLDHQRRIEQRNLRLLSQAATRVEAVLAALGGLREQSELWGPGKLWSSRQEFENRQPYLRVRREPDGTAGRFSIQPTDQSGHRRLLLTTMESHSFEIDVGSILGDLPLRQPPWPFDYLALAEMDGEVIYQEELRAHGESRAGILLKSLAQLGTAPTALEADPAAEAVSEDEEPVSEERLASSHGRVELAGQQMHLLCQPIRIPDLEEGALCGLVAADRVLRESLVVAPQLAMALLLVLVYIVLAWPFIKLLFMNRHERFKLRDAYLLLLSTGGCVLLTNFLLVDASSFFPLSRRVEDGLTELADRVEQTLGSELCPLFDALNEYDEMLCGAEGALVREAIRETGRGSQAGSELPELSLPAASTGAHVHLAFWIDREGVQRARGTVDASVNERMRVRIPDRRLDLSHRGYFKAATKPREAAAATGPVFLDSIVSITTGKHEMVLSKASCLEIPSDGEQETDVGNPVAAIGAAPPSLMQPILPVGFRFAVIDREGRILFHSDSSYVGQILFDELAEGRRLHSAMLARAPASFSSFYQARPSLAFARPLVWPDGPVQLLGATPWWVVTFYDQEVLRTVNLEAMARTTLVSLPYLIAYGLIFTFLALRFRHGRWCWPDEAKIPLYQRLQPRYRVLAIVLLVAIALPPGISWARESAIMVSWVLPIAALLWTLFAFRRHDLDLERREDEEPAAPTSSPDSRKECLREYRHASLLLWVVLAILPGVGLFRASWEAQLDRLAKLNGVHVLKQLRERTSTSHGGRPMLPELAPPTVERDAPFLRTAVHLDRGEMLAEGSGGSETRLLARYLPIYNDTSASLRYLSDDVAADGSLRWEINGNRLWLEATVPWQKTPVSIETTRGPWAGIGAWLLWLVAGLAGTAALGYWIGWGGRRLFFATLPPKHEPRDLPELKRASVSVIAEIADPRHRRRLFAEPAFDRVSLLGDFLERKVEDEVAPHDERTQPVVCAYFESGISNPAIRRWKLRQLETLVYDLRRRVILPVSWSPFEALLSHPKEHKTPETTGPADTPGPMTADSVSLVQVDPEEAGRWGRVLSEFEVWALELADEALPVEPVTKETEYIQGLIARHEGFYWSVWNACSADEKLVLVHLVQESFVNPKQAAVVRRLLHRGLIRREPDLKTTKEEFGRFVGRIHTPDEIASWERQFQGLGWRQLRWAFVGLALVIGLFLFATQPGLFNATLGYVSALTVGIVPVLFHLLNSIQRGPPRRS